jgi:transcriptional regulator with XRE-family HTH domain
MFDTGAFIRSRRVEHGLSQAQLALRAGTTQASLSRLERGQLSPTVATIERLLSAVGESVELTARRSAHEFDIGRLRAQRRRSPVDRLALALGWNRLAGELARAGRAARR